MNDRLQDVLTRIQAASKILKARLSYVVLYAEEWEDAYPNGAILIDDAAVVRWEKERGYVVDRLVDISDPSVGIFNDFVPASEHIKGVDPVYVGRLAESATIEALLIVMTDRIGHAVMVSKEDEQ